MTTVTDLAAQAKALGVTIERLQIRIGAEIGGVDLTRPLNEPLQALIRAALFKHRVIFFRDQDISKEQHIALGRVFGEPEVHPFYRGDYPEITPVRATQATLREHYGGEDPGVNTWHTDMTGRQRPPMAAILRAITVPPLGGDTLWACAVSAYAGLDAETKARIEHLKAEHNALLAFRRYMKTPEDVARITRDYPPQQHPIVRIHPETGERILFVNGSFTTRVIGLEPAESDALLARLFAQFKRPEYQVRFKWRDNSIAIWDERATQHYAVEGFEGADERHLERIAITGEQPFGPDDVKEKAA